MKAEDIGVGFEVGDPIVDGVDYSEYPNGEEVTAYENRELVFDVLDAVQGFTEFARLELGLDSVKYINQFKHEHDYEYGGEKSHFAELQEFHPDGAYSPNASVAYHYSLYEPHGPLADTNDFLQKVSERDYSPEEISEIIAEDPGKSEDDVPSPEEVKSALIDQGFLEADYFQIGDELFWYSNYKEPAVEDGRVLEAFDKAGYSLREVAETLGESTDKVVAQARVHRLTEDS